jgi:hypothetical protein
MGKRLADLVRGSSKQPRLGSIGLTEAALPKRPDRAEAIPAGLNPNSIRFDS